MRLAESRSLENRVRRLFAGDPELLADPYPTWNELRTRHPVWRLDDVVVLSRHADVKQLLGDNNILYSRAATRHSTRYEQARERFSPPGRAAFDRVLGHEFHQLVRMDPPRHPRVRRVVLPPFSARSLARDMEAAVRRRVDENLDRLLTQRQDVVDFKRFAYTLPLEVLGDLLGIPLGELDMVHSWAQKIAENKLNADSEAKAVAADEAYTALLTYIDDLVAQQRATGRQTGLVAAVLDAESAGQLSREELMGMLALMIFAGHETTSNLLAVGLLELLRRPEQWQRLCADPERAPVAVEELLRFVTPAHFLQYVAAESREVAGVPIRAGDTVIGVLAAANRDPDVFVDPDRLDLDRSDSRHHVSLGLGPHFCLGAGLARMEATMLFRSAAQRLPDLRLADDNLEWGGRSLRTPHRLPVALR
ncbi:cytochrome P450 [Micromonospora zingiberis]|nr:cytochrome P450 [Micromonospora zingiberis]